MKYPQLVSTRAVSAISDWLVTQLEQLGVDASPVYSRLLLSLLHTPLQINALDLAELSDHKVVNIGRNKPSSQKGGNNKNYRRFSAADTEAVKRLAAIDSLLEAVPSDQQLSKIETLIDELSSKLRAIEEQNALDDSAVDITDPVESVESQTDSLKKKSATPEDPAKRYFHAFPALSGQSTNNFSQKKAAWPRTDLAPQPAIATVAKEQRQKSSNARATHSERIHENKSHKATDSTMASTETAATSTKGKSNAKANKAAMHGKNVNAVATTATTANQRANVAGKSRSKKKPTDVWDTNFDGAWEMGRDLFREFVVKQNIRNRSMSECEAAAVQSMMPLNEVNVQQMCTDNNVNVTINVDVNSDVRCDVFDTAEENLRRTAAAATSALLGEHVDLNSFDMHLPDSGTFSTASTVTDSSLFGGAITDKMLIRSEGYSTPDTLASWNEQDASVYSLAPRRLYERDISTESINCTGITKPGDVEYGSDCVDSGCDESLHLAAFEAKFDQNVEALWNDCKADETIAMNTVVTQPMHSIWFNYYRNAIDSQPSQVHANDRLAEFTALSQMAVASLDRYAMDGNQWNAFNSTATTKPSGLGLAASIWADNPSNQEDDVSFYANARLWEKSQKALGKPNNFTTIDYEPMARSNATNRDVGMGGTNTATIRAGTTSDIGNFENTTLFKWSGGVNESSFAPIQSESFTGPPSKQESKIRKNLFGNSYFDPYQSHQGVMAANNSGLSMMASNNEPHTTEYAFGHMQKNLKERVTLSNHSSSSCFREVEPLSYEVKQEIRRNNNSRKYQTALDALQTDTEDLLTSERTRFRPIRHTYTDGYAFTVNSELDQINYERSASGTMFYDSEVYREYYSYDDDDNGANRNDESAGGREANNDFVLKYAIRQNDMACQTDDTPPKVFGAPLTSLLQTNRLQSFGGIALGNRMINFNSGIANQPQFVSLRRTADDNDLDNDSMDQMIDINNCYANLKGWSMADTTRCCNNNNTNNNNSHALWEHCSSCSNDMVSQPANRLMKDELSADGDEIMSDLKFLQDLYIGSDWEDADDADMVVEYDDDCDDRQLMQYESSSTVAENTKRTTLPHSSTGDNLSSDPIFSNVNKLISDLLKPEKAQTLVQAIGEKCQSQLGRVLNDVHAIDVTQITQPIDYHTKENNDATKNGAQCNSASTQTTHTTSSNSNNSNTNHFGSLWVYNDDSIWHKDRSTGSGGGDDVWSNAIYSAKNAKHSNERSAVKMTEQWEHANLEKIWSCDPSTRPIDIANDLPSSINDQSLRPSDNPNGLEKFMALVKQANACEQHANTSQIHQCATATAAAAAVAGAVTDEHHRSLQSRTDRKRRHSATSQNFFDQFNYALATHARDTGTDTTKKLATKMANDYNERNLFDCNENKLPAATAIITCKYWTDIDTFCLTSTLAFNDNQLNTNTESFLNYYNQHVQQQRLMQLKTGDDLYADAMDNTESMTMYPFLKQVAAMVSRPLTR